MRRYGLLAAGKGEPILSAGLSVVTPSKFLAVPAWCQWFVEVGWWLSEERAAGKAPWAAIAVPTRSYAAAFLALGAVAHHARLAVMPDAGTQFKVLRSLARGTAVRYRVPGTQQVRIAEFVGTGPYGTRGQLAVHLSGGYSRLARNCGDIEPAPGSARTAGKPQVLSDAPGFVQAALKVPDAGALTYHSRVTCLLVGTKRTFDGELALPLAAGNHSGTLQDLLRCRSFLKRAGDGYLTDAMSASADPGSVPDRFLEPGIVVHDGPHAILRWRSAFPGIPAACVIDRSYPEAVASAARDAIMAERARSAGEVAAPVQPPPAGIELLAFSTGTVQ